MRSRERAVRASVAAVLRHIRRRLGPGEGISAVTRAELAIVRQMLLDGMTERHAEIAPRGAPSAPVRSRHHHPLDRTR